MASASSSKPQDQEQEGRGTQIPLQSFSKSTIAAPVEELSLQADHGSSAGSTEAAAPAAALTAEMDGSHCINIEADSPFPGLLFRAPTVAVANMIKNFLAEAELKAEDHRRITMHLSKFRIHPFMRTEFQQSMLSESLYQQDCLLSRAKLFQEFLRAYREYEQPSLRPDLEALGARVEFRMNGDEGIQKAIERHTNAMEAYRGFRKEADQRVSDVRAMRLAGMLIALEEKKKMKLIAYFAAAMLILPTAILPVVEESFVSLLVACIFIVLVSTLAAGFMVDAAPKDIVAVTAAYAALIVVFVGANSSPGLTTTQPNNATSTG
ncbi:hypothetical protein ACJZ2D_011820 [Fusarium nematophilum]